MKKVFYRKYILSGTPMKYDFFHKNMFISRSIENRVFGRAPIDRASFKGLRVLGISLSVRQSFGPLLLVI